MSSILPPTIVLGTADSNPASVRIITAPQSDFDNPMVRQQPQLRPLLKMYIFLRPNDSDQGGNRIVPMDWPRRNLYDDQLLTFLWRSMARAMAHSVTKQKVAKVWFR